MRWSLFLFCDSAVKRFTERARYNHFEKYTHFSNGETNRRLLYNAMISAGFTNLPSEWWHYDYDTKFWGYFTGKKPLFGVKN